MGSKPTKPNVKIDFKEHLKTQKQVIFNQEVTKGSRPVRGRAMQSGERDSLLPHINHETLDHHRHVPPHLNNESFDPNANIRNPKITNESFGKGEALVDNRTRAQHNRYPYTCIGLLQIQFENSKIRGTAFLISSNWLLTCAHNFYDREERKFGTQASFTLGLQQKDEIYKENGKEYKTKVDVGEIIQISAWRLPDQFINGSDQQAELYDFALVKLKNFYNLEQKYGYFGLDSVWCFKRANIQSELIVAGYPRQIKDFNGKCKFLMESKGPWTEIYNDQSKKENQRKLYVNYKIFTSPGQSGSPIFYETKQKEYYMIGIHTLGGDEENSGVLVTPKTREIINGWIQEMKTIFDISNRNIGNDGMKEFIANFLEVSNKITELQLANNRIGPDGIKFLMNTKWTNLKLLNLENNNIKLQGAKSLAHPSNGWNNLEYLNLNNTMIGDEGCCVLLQNRAWPKLKELHLKRCSLTKITINQLIQNQWTCLETLNLGINQLTSSDIQTLFAPIQTQDNHERKRFQHLRNLNLSKNLIGNEGLEVIVKSDFELESLSITGIGINQHGMKIFASVRWEKLKKLSIDWNKEISIEGIKYLTPQNFPSLTFVNLDWTTLGSQGIKELMRHHWKYLKNLSTNHNYLGDQGLNQLKNHDTLEVLILQGNNITTNGIIEFVKKEEWKNLLQLKLRSNHIKKNGFSEIITRLRNLNYIDINNNGLDAHEKRELKELANQTNPNLHIQVDMGEEADYT